ncbi:MAG: S-layer homology domain-containing protein [Cyanobacteria bacterium P01_C01_bin.70]
MPFVPRSNRQQLPRSLRRRDDWVVLWAALMTFSGGVGWFVADRLFSLDQSLTDSLSLNGSPPPERRQTGAASNSDLDTDAVSPNAVDAGSPNVIVPEPKVPNSPGSSRLSPVRSPLNFTDVADTYWAKPYIDALTARDVLNGLPDGTFAPDRPLSRAELATQVAKAFAVPERNGTKNFTDLPSDYWAMEPINQAVVMGFMTGYPAGDFRPEQTVSRLQVLVTFATGLSLTASPAAQQQLQQYQDWQAVPPWARQQVAAAMQAGIIKVSSAGDRRLRPNEPATRAEVAALTYEALVYLGSVEALP